MNTHRLDADFSNMSDDAILKRLMDNPARIPMLQMTAFVDLREKGFVIFGQEMANCIAIHAHDGDRIIEGVPTLFAWVVITPKGREYLHGKGYMVPDEFGTLRVPRASEQMSGTALTAREQATVEDRVGATVDEIMAAPDPRVFIESRLHEAEEPGEIIGDGSGFEPLILPMEYKGPSPELLKMREDLDRKVAETMGLPPGDGIHGTDGVALRSTAHPIDESALVDVKVTLPPGMSKIELIARGICQRLGHNPDMIVAHYPVSRINAAGIEVYRVPPECETFKMWTLFQPLATVALAEAKDCT